MKLYFISTIDPNDSTGAAIVRRGQVTYLKQKYETVLVAPNQIIESKGTKKNIPLAKESKVGFLLESLGLVNDRLYIWSNVVYRILKSVVTENDILFVTSGGSMAPVLLGYKLKKHIGCKFIVNYHDPTSFTTINGRFTHSTSHFHVNRDSIERKYIDLVDYVITSSEVYKDVLLSKYPQLSSRICCNHFGYINPSETYKETSPNGENYNIVYGGNFGASQAPEILAEAAKGLNNVTIHYVGNYRVNTNILQYKDVPNIIFHEAMPIEDYYKFLLDKADIGFFSLRDNHSMYCVPSKIFDFINLSIPMLAIIKGDGKQIIENNDYGVVAEDSVESLKKVITKICNVDVLNRIRTKLIDEREKWSMEYKIREVEEIIDSLSK